MPRHRAETEDDFDNGYYAQEQGSIVQLTEKAIRNIPAKAFPIGFDITVKPKKETSTCTAPSQIKNATRPAHATPPGAKPRRTR